MNKQIIPAVIVTVGMAAAAAWSQAPAPNPTAKFYDTTSVENAARIMVKTHYATPLENDASREVRLNSLTFPPKVGTFFHRHPGDQWTNVAEGEITFTVRGQAPRTLKVGDSVHVPRGTVHRNQNLTDKPAVTIELNIMDKDKPPVEQVTE